MLPRARNERVRLLARSRNALDACRIRMGLISSRLTVGSGHPGGFGSGLDLLVTSSGRRAVEAFVRHESLRSRSGSGRGARATPAAGPGEPGQIAWPKYRSPPADPQAQPWKRIGVRPLPNRILVGPATGPIGPASLPSLLVRPTVPRVDASSEGRRSEWTPEIPPGSSWRQPWS